MNLYKYNGVYFTDETYYNYNPLPDEWMEMLDPTYLDRKDYIIENSENYSP